MTVVDVVRITAVERLNDGLLVRFESGKCIFYSTILLTKITPQAEEQDDTVVLW